MKALVYYRSGSSAMLAESVHTLIDSVNQGLLALGLRQAGMAPDAKHPLGYGRAAFAWGLVSALGMFWAGGGVALAHGFGAALSPTHAVEVGWDAYGVLAASFLIDGGVLLASCKEIGRRMQMQPGEQGVVARMRAFVRYLRGSNDPFLLAVFLEDVAACGGVILAGAGILASHMLGTALPDALSSIAIGTMLSGVALQLARTNMRYLIGRSVDGDIAQPIRDLIMSFPSVDAINRLQTQWLSPSSFSVSARIDFDGTWLAARLHDEYEHAFLGSVDLRDSLPLLLSLYAEDVTRLVEDEVTQIRAAIRAKFPGAAFIELQPESTAKTLSIRDVGAARHAQETHEILAMHLKLLETVRQQDPNNPRLARREAQIRDWYARMAALRAAEPSTQNKPSGPSNSTV